MSGTLQDVDIKTSTVVYQYSTKISDLVFPPTMAPLEHIRPAYDPIGAKSANQPQPRHIRSQWNKITSMFGSLFIGVLLAIAHAVFYWWLNGKEVDDTLPQAWVTNIGTAFAFLVRMFLVMAASIAFVQHQWRNMKAQTFEVNEIDNITTMLEDVFALLNVRLWTKVPTLVIIAIITWLIPVAAVFPPGTLRIGFLPSDRAGHEQVPQLALSNNSNFYVNQGTVATFSYSDAAPIVYTAALATGTGGEILNLPHIYTNMTYDLQFYAPAIQCRNASTDLRDIVVSHINTTGSGGGYFYISFVGGDDKGLFNTSGQVCGDYGTCSRPPPSALSSSNPTTFENLDTNSTDMARLYVMLGYNLIECHLFNASYDVNFDFRSSAQATTIRKLDILNEVAYNGTAGPLCYNTTLYPDCMQTSTVGSYQAIMEAFGSLYVGTLSGKYTQYTRYQTLVETLSIAPNLTAANENANNDLDSFDIPGFEKQMETQFQNITLSLLSFSGLT